MTFVLTSEQEMLRDTALSFYRDELPTAHLRRLKASGEGGHDAEVLRKLADLGFMGTLVDEGRDMFGVVGLGQLLINQGRTLGATPVLQTALIGVTALQQADDPAQQSGRLEQIASGELTIALALDETAHHRPEHFDAIASKEGDQFVLNGHKRFVPNGQFADTFLVAARSAASSDEVLLMLVSRDQPGVEVLSLETIDGHGAAHVTFDNCEVAGGDMLVGSERGSAVLEEILERARIGTAAELFGVGQAAFEMTLDYLKTRKQFGRLIGSFQALQHRAAKMFIELELSHSCVMAALSAADASSDSLPLLASLAKARAADTVHMITNEAIQLHGGIGMTEEHDIGLFLKRARVLEGLYGGAGFHRDRYAALRDF
jgi:alkylation response protein AidB-like acyl-CoA dehydrogenase